MITLLHLHTTNEERRLIANHLDRSNNKRLATRDEVRTIVQGLLTNYINSLPNYTSQQRPGRKPRELP